MSPSTTETTPLTLKQALVAYQAHEKLASLSALARRLAIGDTTVSNWIKGGGVEKPEHRAKLVEALVPIAGPFVFPDPKLHGPKPGSKRGQGKPAEERLPLPPKVDGIGKVSRVLTEEVRITLCYADLARLLGLPEATPVLVYPHGADLDDPSDSIDFPMTVSYTTTIRDSK